MDILLEITEKTFLLERKGIEPEVLNIDMISFTKAMFQADNIGIQFLHKVDGFDTTNVNGHVLRICVTAAAVTMVEITGSKLHDKFQKSLKKLYVNKENA